jgi:hypothetical protein
VELTKVSQEARAFGRPTPKHMDVYCPANVIALSFFVVVGFFRTQLARARGATSEVRPLSNDPKRK